MLSCGHHFSSLDYFNLISIRYYRQDGGKKLTFDARARAQLDMRRRKWEWLVFTQFPFFTLSVVTLTYAGAFVILNIALARCFFVVIHNSPFCDLVNIFAEREERPCREKCMTIGAAETWFDGCAETRCKLNWKKKFHFLASFFLFIYIVRWANNRWSFMDEQFEFVRKFSQLATVYVSSSCSSCFKMKGLLRLTMAAEQCRLLYVSQIS